MTAAQLAALGAAASWRLGKWDLVEGYVQAANAGFAQLDTNARWEVGTQRFRVHGWEGWIGGVRLGRSERSKHRAGQLHRALPLRPPFSHCVPPFPLQVRIARLLWAVARKDTEALQCDLQAARSEVMGPFSGGWFVPWFGVGLA